MMISVKSIVFIAMCFAPSAFGVPVYKRRVPQEHSHQPFLISVTKSLNLKNPNQIKDPVFGLLGDAAAAGGQGLIKDTDCLQQATADQAFTNAKAAGDVDGQVAALIYRALERNTGKVGLPSAPCKSIKAVNSEIAAISQHQDSSAGAATIAANKAITLALAQQIKNVGGDPTLAIKAGTFAPGDLNDPTARGGSCDDANDANGCIFTLNLLDPDATVDEINAAVGAASAPASSSNKGSSGGSAPAESSASDASCPPDVTVTVSAPAAASTSSGSASSSSSGGDGAAASSPLNFGKCTNPTVQFGAGLDGRKATEFSFINVDQTEFKHGSALNPNIIFQFTCDNLVNNCGLTNADSTVKTCRSGQATAAALGKVGAAADSFNAALGFKTDFAALDV